jgi:N-acetyl-beta-hexosaminidase
MINLLPEPKRLVDKNCFTKPFKTILIDTKDKQLVEIAENRFWNYKGIVKDSAEKFVVELNSSLADREADNKELFITQGYALEILKNKAILSYENNAGYINGLTSLKVLLVEEEGTFRLPCCEIVDWPSVAVRAVAPHSSDSRQ